MGLAVLNTKYFCWPQSWRYVENQKSVIKAKPEQWCSRWLGIHLHSQFLHPPLLDSELELVTSPVVGILMSWRMKRIMSRLDVSSLGRDTLGVSAGCLCALAAKLKPLLVIPTDFIFYRPKFIVEQFWRHQKLSQYRLQGIWYIIIWENGWCLWDIVTPDQVLSENSREIFFSGFI